jgi:hypothetical protein
MRKTALLAATALLLGSTSQAMAGPVVDLLAGPVRSLFTRVASKKGDRVFHAAGDAYHGSVRGADGATHPAVIRVSRGGASKPGRPDILGVAVKVMAPAGEQDFLLVSAFAERGLGARVPSFRGSLAGQPISSLTSFRAAGRKGPITGKLPSAFSPPLDLERGVGPAMQRRAFTLSIQDARLFASSPKSTPLARVTVHFDQPLNAADRAGLRFTPFHDAGGVEPVGLINALRKAAYQGSQAGRGL